MNQTFYADKADLSVIGPDGQTQVIGEIKSLHLGIINDTDAKAQMERYHDELDAMTIRTLLKRHKPKSLLGNVVRKLPHERREVLIARFGAGATLEDCKRSLELKAAVR